MARNTKKQSGGNASGATLGYEAQLWQMADALSPPPEPIVERTWPRAVQSRTLAVIRDTLLPELIFGDLLVKDAEKLAESAV